VPFAFRPNSSASLAGRVFTSGTSLRDFVSRAVEHKRIRFGDLRRLQREHRASWSAKAGPQLLVARLSLTLSEQHQDGRGNVAPEDEPCEGHPSDTRRSENIGSAVSALFE
jgi:hypothetical protein